MDKFLQKQKNIISRATGGRSKKRYSGLQLRVLSLYRKMLRAAETKQQPEQWKPYIRSEFKKYATKIPANAHQRVEFFLRQGQSQMNLLVSEQVTDLTVFGAPQEVEEGEKHE